MPKAPIELKAAPRPPFEPYVLPDDHPIDPHFDLKPAPPQPPPKKTKVIVGLVLLSLAVTPLLATIGVGAGLAIAGPFSWDRTYSSEVGSHVKNAYYSSTPELMISELNKAVDGMHRLGLDGYYDTVWWPDQTPDHHMDYQFKHMQAVIDRANDVIKWRDSQGDKGSGAQLGDVYGQKVDALRNFICCDGGWSDYIAHGAFFVARHPFVAFYSDFGAVIAGFDFLFLLIFAAIGVPVYRRGRAEMTHHQYRGIFS